MTNRSNGRIIAELDECTYYNLEPTIFGVFGVVSLAMYANGYVVTYVP
jgi:hypothetical protein